MTRHIVECIISVMSLCPCVVYKPDHMYNNPFGGRSLSGPATSILFLFFFPIYTTTICRAHRPIVISESRMHLFFSHLHDVREVQCRCGVTSHQSSSPIRSTVRRRRMYRCVLLGVPLRRTGQSAVPVVVWLATWPHSSLASPLS